MLRLLTDGGAKIIRCDDYYIRELASGLDECIFSIDVWDPLYPELVEEAQIQDADGKTYLIKQIDGGANSAKIIARIDLDAWEAEMHLAYGNGIKTVYQTVNAVKPSGWTVVDQSGSTIRRTVNGNLTSLEICQECEDTFFVWFRWDNAAKTCTIHSKIPPAPVGAFATRDLNLKQINYKGKSNDIRTRIYAYGQDGMTFASINGGKPYLDDNRYTDKILPMFWKDERYTVPENLMHDAAEKLAAVAVPQRSYDCAVVDLRAVDPEKYGFLDFSLFTTATLIDDIKNFAVDYQVVERHVYPYYPEKNDVIFDTSPQKLTAVLDNTKDLLEARPTAEQVQIDVDRATGVLQTGKSGYVVIGRNADGYANEIYFLDQPSLEDAVQVLRINRAGIGFSSSGAAGPYYQAWDLQGHLTLGGVNNSYGDLMILDENAVPKIQIDKEGLKLWDIAAIGFYYQGAFYTDGAHTTLITPTDGSCYYDLATGDVYIYTEGAYSQVSGKQGLLAKMTQDGLAVYAGVIDFDWGTDTGFKADGTQVQIGDFVCNSTYGRSIFQSIDEKTGISADPSDSDGLYLWAGWNSENSYVFQVGQGDAYVMYNGTEYEIGKSIAGFNNTALSGSDDDHDSGDGDEPDPDPQDPEDPDVMEFDHIEVVNDLPPEPQRSVLRAAVRSAPTPITKTYDMLILNGVKGWIRDSWARRKIDALQTAMSGTQSALDATQLAAVNSGITAAQLQSILTRLHDLDGQ